MDGAFFLMNWLYLGMDWLYSVVTPGSLVLTIVIATLIIRGITIFSDINTRKQSMKTAQIQPELDKLKKKYPRQDQAQELSQAQMKLMKENGISMFAGCLPMIITLVVFMSFFSAFRFWGYNEMAKVIYDTSVDEQKGIEEFEKFGFLWVKNIWQPDNMTKNVVMVSNEFFKIDLHKLDCVKNDEKIAEDFVKWGWIGVEEKTDENGNVTKTYTKITDPSKEAVDKYVEISNKIRSHYDSEANGYFVLPVIAAVLNFLSAWVMRKSQPKNQNNPMGNGNFMLFLMPALSFYFCLSYTSAFAIYWSISCLISVAVNVVLSKKYSVKPIENK